MPAHTAQQEAVVVTVSELNARIKALLESSCRFVWVKGEISNFRVPASGHFYFTLKDAQSQIRGVFFRAQHRHLRFTPEDGLQVICQGRISVYEPRGEYQLIVEVMEPQGRGALQLAFEQLKQKLQKEGLFEPARKLPLPLCPQSIVVVTSPGGAAIRDIIKTLKKSPFPLEVTVIPVRVQGEGAAGELAAAIETANALQPRFRWDLMIVGRGGGSIEDLWSFNEENVARAVFASRIPIISAVGHEIDFTICDMAADLRAPTPTAAAEWVVARLENLRRELTGYRDRMLRTILHRIDYQKQRIRFLDKRLIDPKRRIEDLKLLVDDRMERLLLACARSLERFRTGHAHLYKRLLLVPPTKAIQQLQNRIEQLSRDLALCYRRRLEHHRFLLKENASMLESLSPLAVLARGYSIAYRLSDGTIIRRSANAKPGEAVLIRLSRGVLECTVNRSEE